MAIKCIAFDLDNTLWECDPLIVKAEKKFYTWLETAYPKITSKLTHEKLVAHRVAYMKARPELHHNLTVLRKNWLRDLIKEVDKLDIDDEFIETGFQVFWQERNNVIFYDGAINMLESLAKHYSLGVITNGNADVDFIGIGDYFDFSLSSQEAGVSKPHKAIYRQALDISQTSADETIYVGDDPKCDVIGAQNLGIRAIWYNPKLQPWPGGKAPAVVVKHHDELQDKIANL